jgi:UDP-GlcNAc:undecaprenyl-phosphate/decaprenyl-phosphate GlcNAc-1-phosphate transferase
MGTAALYALVVAVAFAGTSLLLPLVKRFCFARGWLDRPGGRKQHRNPVPRLGGIAFLVSFVATVLLGVALAPTLFSIPLVRALVPGIASALAEAYRVRPQLLGLLAGALVIFLVGLLDDVLGDKFPVGLKLCGQSAAAIVAVSAGIQVDFTGVEALNAAVSFLWILGISNAFNLLDNMDGLAAGVAICSAFIFFLNALALEEIFLCLILAAFVGALAGFLRQNLHPARIFMGDAGALFIGFMLSSLTILEHYVSPASSSLFPVLMPPLVLAVPLIDTLSVVVIRIAEGRPIYRGDRCHLSHRLVSAGIREPQAVNFLMLLTLALGLGALQLANASFAQSLWTIACATALAALVLLGIGVHGAVHRGLPEAKSRKPAEGL